MSDVDVRLDGNHLTLEQVHAASHRLAGKGRRPLPPDGYTPRPGPPSPSGLRPGSLRSRDWLNGCPHV